MFAPNHHPAMKNVAPVRKELGVRTIFNILGPLTNPASAPNILMGVFHSDLVGIQVRALQRLGAEPFDPGLTAERFHAALHGRRAPVKQLLLGGEVVVGAGNIYACEALFQAGIHPALRADRISRPPSPSPCSRCRPAAPERC
jgi:hypothetical protein